MPDSAGEQAIERPPAWKRGALLIAFLAALIRIWVAWDAYRTPLDSAHFVQHGVELANGNPDGLSYHWSLGPILMSAAAHRLGSEPGLWLQCVTVLAGAGLVIALMIMILRLTGSRPAAWLSGAVAAVHPVLIQYSVNSMGEMPYLFFLVSAIALFLPPPGEPVQPARRFLFSSITLGFGMLYRPVECCIAYALLTAWQLLRTRPCGLSAWRQVLPGLLAFAVFVAPQTLLTARKTGVVSPSSKVMISLAYGADGNDTKVLYALHDPRRGEVELIKEKGVFSYLWLRRNMIAGNYIRNMAAAFRTAKDQLFPAGFKLGTGWAFAWMLATVWLLRERPWRPLLMAGGAFSASLPAVVSLSFIHPRFMVPLLPFTIAMSCAAAWRWASRLTTFGARAIAALVLLLFMANSALFAKHTAGDGWVGRNVQAVGERMRQFAGEDDLVMSVGPQVAVSFYREKPLNWRSLPYGEIDAVLENADQRNIRLIVVARNILPHWPIQKLFEGAPLPEGWTILDRIVFERYNPRWGDETDEYLLVGRIADTGAVPTEQP